MQHIEKKKRTAHVEGAKISLYVTSNIPPSLTILLFILIKIQVRRVKREERRK
ncbi:hypothetical protein [Saccharolobus solfataricus]|uniref:Uncharacterized protein n=1 Tax=Saccharolobus solfataricus (strain 98/2) TaxID=555311 RepID=D0KRI8_SACS9|nr:hypothetical protein [Saccharolobus solfataricus]